MSSRLLQRCDHAVRTLSPGYFALTMASGIISVGMHLEGFGLISRILLIIGAISFIVLCVLTALRAIRHRNELRFDFLNPRRAFGFFTFVAGANVLGTRLGIAGQPRIALTLLVIASTAWLVLGYVVPWTAALGKHGGSIVARANGTWFIWAVASQSVAVSAASLQPNFSGGRNSLALLAVVAWSIGLLQYAAAGVFVALRLMQYRFGPTDLTPPYWVAMGALAITVLAGAHIVTMADAPMSNATRGLIGGLAVVLWSFATWLIPPLIAAGYWRHAIHRIRLRYEPTLWSIIFPLGMYSVASLTLGDSERLPFVTKIGQIELWIALAAWLVTFVAMLRHLSDTLLRHAARGSGSAHGMT